MKLAVNNQSGRVYARLRTGNPTKPYLRLTLGTTSLEEARKLAKEAKLGALESSLQASQLSLKAAARLAVGKRLSVKDATVEWFAAQRRRGLSDATIAKGESVIAHWFSLVPVVASLPPSSITEAHLDPFINRESATAGYSTRARELAVLRAFLAFCSDMNYLVGNPAGRGRFGIKHRQLSHAQRERKERVPFTEAEIRKVLDGTEGWDHWFIGIAAATGLRLGDIAQLEHASLSVPGHIVVWTEKRDRRVCLPINEKVTPGLPAILSQIPPADGPYVFPEQAAQYADIKSGRPKFSVYFGRLFQHFGIEGKSFHCLRHTAISRWHRLGIDLERCKEFAGHTSTSAHEGYIHS